MTAAPFCDHCGTILEPQGELGKLCPRCLLHGQLIDTQPLTPVVPEDIATVAAAFPELEILELRGRGGMGVVYRARQKHLDRVVALKLLPKQQEPSPELGERFRREARAMARLGHPHIVALHDFGERDGRAYLILEYVEGPSLREVLHQRSLAPMEALRITREVAEGLAYAHSQGVIHRDIKPENILLDSAGRAKLVDFGLAKWTDRPEGEITLTQSQQIMGTLAYMAPEQRRDPQGTDHRVDLYALGVVLYEMLTGEHPMGRFPAPSQCSEVEAGIDDAVLRALESDPDLRPQSAEEFLRALAATETSPTLVPTPPGPASVATPEEDAYGWIRRVPGRELVVGLAALGLSVLWIVAHLAHSSLGLSFPNAPPSLHDPAPSAPDSHRFVVSFVLAQVALLCLACRPSASSWIVAILRWPFRIVAFGAAAFSLIWLTYADWPTSRQLPTAMVNVVLLLSAQALLLLWIRRGGWTEFGATTALVVAATATAAMDAQYSPSRVAFYFSSGMAALITITGALAALPTVILGTSRSVRLRVGIAFGLSLVAALYYFHDYL